MKKETSLLFILSLLLAFNTFAQTATVIKLEKDRTGSRFANKWWIRSDGPNQIWRSGPTNKATRKTYVKAGKSDLLVGLGPTPGSIDQMLNGTRETEWTTLKAGKAREYGNPSELVIISTGAGKFYVQVEWNRKRSSLLGW